MERETALAWMAIQRLPAARTAALRRLLRHNPDPCALLETPASALDGAGLPAEWFSERHRLGSDPQWRGDSERLLERLHAAGVSLLDARDPRWPPLLQEVDDAPYLLYVRGDPALLSTPQLAIVGSRKATRQGLETAAEFAAELARAGMTVTSGLALGIDAAAHRGALDVAGNTVAVIGTGIDIRYPRANRALADAIAAAGAVVTELPPGTPPTPDQFPQRNRIISALSLGVLVVEAALRSGSLITARLALEQNREVFAVPGSIRAGASRGCNALLQNGAKLVTCVGDILEEYSGWTAAAAEPGAPLPAAGPRAEVMAAIGFQPDTLDSLQQATGLSPAQLLPLLTELQLRGEVEQIGGCWQRVR